MDLRKMSFAVGSFTRTLRFTVEVLNTDDVLALKGRGNQVPILCLSSGQCPSAWTITSFAQAIETAMMVLSDSDKILHVFKNFDESYFNVFIPAASDRQYLRII